MEPIGGGSSKVAGYYKNSILDDLGMFLAMEESIDFAHFLPLTVVVSKLAKQRPCDPKSFQVGKRNSFLADTPKQDPWKKPKFRPKPKHFFGRNSLFRPKYFVSANILAKYLLPK